MSKPGLFRSLKEFFRELRSFGHPVRKVISPLQELDNLKLQARALQKELDELEAMRAAREKQEEALAMMQMQNTVQNLQQLDKILQKSEKMIAAAVQSAGARTDEQIKTMLQQKAEEVVSKLDLQKAMSLDIPPEQIVQDVMQQATAQLQSEGESVSLAAPGQQTNLDSPAQVGPPAAGKQADKASGHLIQHQQKRQMHQHAWHALPPR